MPEKYQPSPEEVAKAETLMTRTQKKMSDNQESHLEREGVFMVISRIYDKQMHLSDHGDPIYSNDIPPDVLERWPKADHVVKLSGQAEDGRKIEVMMVLNHGETYRDANPDNYAATIDGESISSVGAQKLFLKYGEDAGDYRAAKEANRELAAEYPNAEESPEKRRLYEDLL